MSLAAGSATSGKTGALALQIDSAGSPIYLPHGGFNPTVMTGKAIVPLVNNTAFSSNETQGLSMARFDLAMPFIAGLHNAALFAALFGYVAGDADTANYHVLTNYPDDAGSAPATYAQTKFATLAQKIGFSADGLSSAIGQRLSGMVVDPESGAVGPLAAPSAGPISNSGVLGYQQTNVLAGANALDGVAEIQVSIDVTLVITPGKRAGTNAAYPYLINGLLATNLSGSVSVTQIRNARYQLLGDGILTLNMGAAGAGVAEALSLMPVSLGKPSGLGINYVTNRYALKSISGEQPVNWTNL